MAGLARAHLFLAKWPIQKGASAFIVIPRGHSGGKCQKRGINSTGLTSRISLFSHGRAQNSEFRKSEMRDYSFDASSKPVVKW